MRGRLSMQTSQLSQSSLLCSLPALAVRCSDNLIATELPPHIRTFVIVWLTALCNLGDTILLCARSTESGYPPRR
jgi:hypothetical protein